MNAEIDISNVVLRTERLILRPWQESDLDDFFEYASVDGVGEMAGWSHHKTIEETQTILTAFINEKKTFPSSAAVRSYARWESKNTTRRSSRNSAINRGVSWDLCCLRSTGATGTWRRQYGR